jgi:ubiquinone/menaquinone biosynthesis C-methylase UbiE
MVDFASSFPRRRNMMLKLQAWWDRTVDYYSQRLIEVILGKHIEKLYLVMGGHIFFQTLSAAVDLDLFTLLEKNRRLTLAEITKLLDLQEKPARILLLGLTTLGLIKKSGDAYSNGPVAKRVLVRGVPGNIIPVIEWQHHINYKAIYWFRESIKANENIGLREFKGDEPTLYERLTHHPELEEIFQKAMQSISTQANTLLAKYVDFSHVRHLVDVGGGNGSNIMALAKRYSHLKATVFDSPTVCQMARDHIQQAGLSSRLDAVPGDCFKDPFPAGADCILFGHFFTIWSEEKDRALLKKCYEALPPGGSVIIFNMMQRDDGTGPLSAAMGSPYFLTLATGEGMLYTWGEYESWMKEAGFAKVAKQALPRDHGVIIGFKS